ncbi:CatA-like O-acetyltransferase [Bacillus cereus]|nr:CatA-like O-acetyltransferase [Bacillus cereus]EEK62361.1 Chloramphenicol acetyltransferase [Bacillus cereus 172560W]MDA1934862.1 CatA-like O-acetyltransferase [Bacillus cereus]MDA1940768.1 CatA-like O-acetyltransferase [Bacillus cereus]MDZ4587257.1 CatA-like O-acetyltransferase [Bacillus cereus]MDZ4598443.1 CatA-like O-acetyltransferase [Bacillus cereus]
MKFHVIDREDWNREQYFEHYLKLKYFNEGNKVMLPVSLQIHHSVCDGYDASQFIEDLQQLSNTCNDWLK